VVIFYKNLYFHNLESLTMVPGVQPYYIDQENDSERQQTAFGHVLF
jgi:hypothetical protein